MPYIAFYKGKETMWDKFVSFITRSNITHVELYHNGFFYSSSSSDKGVRRKRMTIDIDKWEVIELPYNEKYYELNDIYSITMDADYDYTSVFINWLGIQKDMNSKSFFCVEYVVLLLNYLYGLKLKGNVMPNKLFNQIKGIFR